MFHWIGSIHSGENKFIKQKVHEMKLDKRRENWGFVIVDKFFSKLIQETHESLWRNVLYHSLGVLCTHGLLFGVCVCTSSCGAATVRVEIDLNLDKLSCFIQIEAYFLHFQDIQWFKSISICDDVEFDYGNFDQIMDLKNSLSLTHCTCTVESVLWKKHRSGMKCRYLYQWNGIPPSSQR